MSIALDIGVFDKGVQQSSVKGSQILSGVMPMPASAGRAYPGKITLSLARRGWNVPATAGWLLREAQNIYVTNTSKWRVARLGNTKAGTKVLE